MNNDGHWLNSDRLYGHPRLFIILYCLFCVVWAVLAKEGMDPYGKPISYDFITFWSASRVALDGAPLDAYVPIRLFGAQQAAVPELQMIFLWHYPPTFYLVILPLVLLALPLAWLGMHGLRTGWRCGERNLLVLCWLLPVFIAPLAGALQLQFAPFVLFALLFFIWRRVAEERQASD